MIPRFFPERFSQSERRRIREFAASKGVSIAFHGPSDYLNIGSLYPEVRRAVLNRTKLCLDFACDVGAERLTIHIEPPFDFVFAGRKGTFLKDHWALYKNTLKESLVEIAEYSKGKVLVCIENNQLSRMAIEVLDEVLSTENLSLTWDIPKSHTGAGKPIAQIEDFLMRHLEKVKECHLHDQKPRRHSHDILGVGKLDFSRYLKLLAPKDVHFTLEIRPREKALESLKILKGMLLQLGWRISSSAKNRSSKSIQAIR